jgi:hypothetical protein
MRPAMDNKQLTLVRRLQTGAGTLAWEKSEGEEAYEAESGGFTLQIVEVAGTDPLYIIRLYDQESTLLDEFSDEDLTEVLSRVKPTEPSEMFTVMQDIFRAARRSALGADRAIDAFLSVLKS